MKFLLLFLFLALTFRASAQWESVFNPEQGTDLHDVHLISGEHGVAVGKLGTILMTYDGFHTWKRIACGTSKDFYALHFFDATTAVAAGVGGMILRSTDGGNSWSAIISGTSDSLYKFSSLSPTSALLVGSNGTILKTTNKGLNWSRISSGTTMSLLSVSSKGSTCITTGKNGIILRSTDSGESWKSIPIDTKVDFYTVSWVTNSTVLVGGDSCAIYRSTDAGESWQFDRKIYIRDDQWTSDEIFDIQFANDSVGYLCGRLGSGGTSAASYIDYARIHYTKDAGKTWQRLIGVVYDTLIKKNNSQFSNSSAGFWRRIVVIQPDSVIVVGFYPYSSTGLSISGSSVVIAGGPNSPVFEIRLNAVKTDSMGFVTALPTSFTNVRALSASHWIASTIKGEVLETNDAGKSWKKSNQQSLDLFQKFNGNFGIQLADSGRISISNDGGNTWKFKRIDSGVSQNIRIPIINEVAVIDSLTALIMGLYENYAFKMLRTNDGGKTWKYVPINTDSTTGLFSLYFTDSKHGWVSEQPFYLEETNGNWFMKPQGRLHYTSDGGITWTDRTPTVIQSRDKFWNQHIDFIDPLHGWITAYEKDSSFVEHKNFIPLLFSTNDGGESWRRIVIDAQPFLSLDAARYDLTFMDVMGIDSLNYVLYLGYDYSNRVIRTTDGGITWKEMTYSNGLRTTNNRHVFYRADSATFFMFGDNSMLYKWKYTIEATGVDEVIDVPASGLTITPNPTSTTFTISGIDNMSSVKILNSLGMEVSRKSLVVSGKQEVDVSDLAAGVYFVQVRTTAGVVSKAVVVAR